MKFLVKLILTALLTFLLGMFWHFYMVAAIVVLVNMLVRTRSFVSFGSGFLGFGTVWLIHAWMLSSGDAVMIHARIAELLGISGVLLLLVIFLIGGLTGGFAALTGSTLMGALARRKRSNNPYH